MDLRRCMRRIAVLVFLFPFLVYSGSLCQDTGVGVNPTLRQQQALEKHQELTPLSYVIVDVPSKKLLGYYPELQGLVPATSQGDLTTLLAKVSANQDSFLYGVPNLSSQEKVTRENLDRHGWAQGLPIFTKQCTYLIRAHATGEGIRFSEGRGERVYQKIEPDIVDGFTVAQQFAIFPLQFHSFHQARAKFRYLGRQALDNRQVDVVAFAQELDRSQLTGVVIVNGQSVPVFYQGIAWIDPDNFQIVRMRIDLLRPRPEVGWQKMDIGFTELRLPLVTKPLWLPQDVVVTRPTKDGALREKHEFSDYRVFVTSKPAPSIPPSAEKTK